METAATSLGQRRFWRAVRALPSRIIARVPSVNSPVLIKEMRCRLRGRRAFSLLLVYVGLTSLALLTMVALMGSQTEIGRGIIIGAAGPGAAPGGYPGRPSPSAAAIGRSALWYGSFLHLTLLLFITPGLAAGAVAGERERQTLGLLAITPLTTRSIIAGKLGAALAYVVLLILCSLPLSAVCFVFGGVSPLEPACLYLVLLTAAVMFTTIGLTTSIWLRSTAAASGAAYGVTFFLIFGLPIVSSMLPMMGYMSSPSYSTTLMAFMVKLALVLIGAFPLAAVAFAVIAMLMRRRRRMSRAQYLALFGGVYCATVAAVHIPVLREILVGGAALVAFPLTMVGNPYGAMGSAMMAFVMPGSPMAALAIWLVSVGLYVAVAASLFMICVRKMEQSRSPQGMAAWLAPRPRAEVAA